MPRSRSTHWAGIAASLVLVAGVAGARAQEPSPAGSIDEAGWQGVLGVRPTVSTAQRYVVLLREPSLAERVLESGGHASEADMRKWTADAITLQEQFLARMAAAGARIPPEHRYVRVLNGISTRLDPTSLSLLEDDREVEAIYPVRIAYPAQTAETIATTASAVTGLEVPGLDGTGVTVAVLDTGVDPTHPYLRASILPGIDVIAPGSGAVAQPHPTIPGRPERHATELAGIVTGSEGPAGLRGVAPGASILPVRIAGWQPDAEGGFAVYSRTDQILAGLEAAVDPNDDGDTLDAARVALLGVVEPYASFSDGPLARAITGATALDTLVVVPAGNDGEAGPSYGSIAGPGGAPDALTVAASDARPATPTVRVLVRAGLRVLFEDALPLGGAPTGTVTADVVPVRARAASRGITALFDRDGVSTIAGRASLLPRGALSEETVEEATTAGAVAVLVNGPLPAGAFSLDVPAGVPVIGLAEELVKEIRSFIAGGVPVTVSIGGVDVAENLESGAIAAFSSRGLALGGGLKPDVLAAGVAIPTSEPGRGDEGEVRFGTMSGTSAAAAVAAGAAAVLGEGRPGLSAAELRGLLVGSARRTDLDVTASGAGLIDLRAAVQQEVVSVPASISFGTAGSGPEFDRSTLSQTIRIQNVSSRTLAVRVGTAALAPKGVEITVEPDRVRLRPGRGAEVLVQADTRELSQESGIATGELVLRSSATPEVHVPWAVAVPARPVDLVSRLSLRRTGPRLSDATPAVLGLVAGAVTADPAPQVRPLQALDVQLWRGDTFLGVLARRHELLPGRYRFGLTGRGPDGARLPSGSYVVRVVARPGDGGRRQVESIPYPVP